MTIMMLTYAVSFIYAYRFKKGRLMFNGAARSLRTTRRVFRGAARNLAAITMLGSLPGISVAIAEDIKAVPSLPPRTEASSSSESTYPQLRASMSYKIVMSPHGGTERLDRDIQAAQRRVREAAEPKHFLEQLGWLYVAKARASCDQGFYKLAERCALTLEEVDSKSPEAKLLRGHVLISFHRFAEAEAIARELVNERTLPFDYALLGDALMEQGRLDEAIAAYEEMVDLRPGLQAYSRVAHMRWLKGDSEGALEVARMAARAASPLDPEAASWALTRLALYYFQAGSTADASVACDSALAYSPDYPAALFWRGRLLMTADRTGKAVEPLQKAAERNPLPEFQWVLADALRAAGRSGEATAVETKLKKDGARNDPRTYALFLATRGEETALAIQLAQREFNDRSDIFTHDALAWALAAAGRPAEAWPHMDKALAEGTLDARLFTHAGVIAAKLGRTAEAASWLAKARDLQHLLYPSEQQHLAASLAALEASGHIADVGNTETIASGEDRLTKASLADENKERKDK